MSPRNCACPYYDAVNCMRARSPARADDDDGYYQEERCECSCHDDDDDSDD